MSYWSALPVGLALGVLLFSIAYWRGIREGRRRARQEKQKDMDGRLDAPGGGGAKMAVGPEKGCPCATSAPGPSEEKSL